MVERRIALISEADTRRLGCVLAHELRIGDAVLLSGPLGAGKTVLARALIEEAGGGTDAGSPTFGLLSLYDGAPPIAHSDLYRLDRPEEIYELGLDETGDENALIVEWPERAPPGYFADALEIRIELDAHDRREAIIAAPASWRERMERAAARWDANAQ